MCEISFRDATGLDRVLSVWGQPIINAPENLVAFSSCADDGCEPQVVVVDIARGVVLRGTVPTNDQQHYYKLSWQKAGRVLSVLDEGIEAHKEQHFLCAVASEVVCSARGP